MRDHVQVFVQTDSVEDAFAVQGMTFTVTASDQDEWEPRTVTFEAKVEDDTPTTNGVYVRTYSSDAYELLAEEQIRIAVSDVISAYLTQD